ncbi:hypothetical protein V492_01475 [Pseudogymnoascus sp. VKM F-4246]|nr:hypothetical protein V492_01475 [Pseudogymnoascus sp. VKM F-4246]
MSQRQATSRPVSQSTADGLSDRLPTDAFRGQEGQHARLDHGDEDSREQSLQQPSHQPVTQPPAQHYTPMTPGNSRAPAGAPRGVGVHTMLNPTESGTDRGYSALGSNAQAALVDRSQPQQTTGTDIPTLTSHSNHPPNSPGLLPTNAVFGGRRRRGLAPNVHRSVSLGSAAMGSQRPFGQPPPEREMGWPHVIVPGSGASSEIPPVPAIPAHIRSPINLPPPVSGPPLNRRASVAVMGGPTARLPNSQSASPNSPFSYSNHPSPAPTTHMSQPPTGQPFVAGSTLMGPFAEGASSQGSQQEQGQHMGHLPERIPLQEGPSGGHLFLATESGQIMVPVDLEAGSIEAGNKRKRNADASARFRERNREKKLQESKEINDLEQKVQEKDRLADYYKELAEYEKTRSDFFQGEMERLWRMLYDNPATRSQVLQAPLRTPTVREPPPFPHGLPSGPSLQPPGGETGPSERPPRRRRLDNDGERRQSGNQTRLEEGQHLQYPPPTTPFAPPPSRPEGGQHPQYLPPHTRSVSGPGLVSAPLSNAAVQRPQSIFYPQSGSDRPWATGQLPQPAQGQQRPQQQLPRQPQYQPQYQAQNQAQDQAQHQAQQQ